MEYISKLAVLRDRQSLTTNRKDLIQSYNSLATYSMGSHCF